MMTIVDEQVGLSEIVGEDNDRPSVSCEGREYLSQPSASHGIEAVRGLVQDWSSCSSGCCCRASCTRCGCPAPEEEALATSSVFREAPRVDLMRCRHRLSKLLLRHELRLTTGAGDGSSPYVAGAG